MLQHPYFFCGCANGIHFFFLTVWFKGCYSTPIFFVAVPMAYIFFFDSIPLFKSVPVDLCTTYPLLQAV